MKRSVSYLSAVLISGTLLWGCSPSFQGIRMRAQGPEINEAFRKLVLAAETDEYRTTLVDPVTHRLETDWRNLKEKEMVAADRALPTGAVQSRLTLQLQARGRLFEVYCSPELRYREGENWRVNVADVRHPLWEKWVRTINALVEKEAKEED
jgi:hypothetical protein